MTDTLTQNGEKEVAELARQMLAEAKLGVCTCDIRVRSCGVHQTVRAGTDRQEQAWCAHAAAHLTLVPGTGTSAVARAASRFATQFFPGRF